LLTGLDPKISNIRTTSVNDEVKNSTCAADISYSVVKGSNAIEQVGLDAIANKSMPITYTLSINSDGQLYAEVSGL
jgi:hypothetical protein